MPPLMSIDRLIAQSERPVYVICPYPEWPHYDPDNFPAPLAEWMAQHCPDVAISRLSCFTQDNLVYLGEANEDKTISDLTHSPIFLIGFNDEQAVHFSEAWKNPPLNTPESPSDFYFIICGNRTVLKIQEDDDDIYAISTTGLLPNQSPDETDGWVLDLTRLKDVGSPLQEPS